MTARRVTWSTGPTARFAASPHGAEFRPGAGSRSRIRRESTSSGSPDPLTASTPVPSRQLCWLPLQASRLVGQRSLNIAGGNVGPGPLTRPGYLAGYPCDRMNSERKGRESQSSVSPCVRLIRFDRDCQEVIPIDYPASAIRYSAAPDCWLLRDHGCRQVSLQVRSCNIRENSRACCPIRLTLVG